VYVEPFLVMLNARCLETLKSIAIGKNIAHDDENNVHLLNKSYSEMSANYIRFKIELDLLLKISKTMQTLAEQSKDAFVISSSKEFESAVAFLHDKIHNLNFDKSFNVHMGNWVADVSFKQ
jgi:hypothetical protein